MKTFPNKPVLSRYILIAWVFVALGFAILGRATYIMTAQRGMWDSIRATVSGKANISIDVMRGDIYSDDGQDIAAYAPKYKLKIDFNIYDKDKKQKAKTQAQKDAEFLARIDYLSEALHRIIPEKTADEFREKMKEGFDKKRACCYIYTRLIDHLTYKRIKDLPFFCKNINYSGFNPDVKSHIDKPYGNLASRLLGDLDDEGRGRTGLEYSFDSIMSGEKGKAHSIKVMNRFLTITDKEPVPGASLHTTLNIDIQDFCEQALRERLTELNAIYGLAMVMDVKTGDIKAMVNLTESGGKYLDLQNYAVTQELSPGSVFKPVTIAAALESGKLKWGTTVNTCSGVVEKGGHKFHDEVKAGAKPNLSIPEAIGHSSNVGIIKLVLDNAYKESRNSHQALCDDIEKLGILSDLQLDLKGYKTAQIHSPALLGNKWSKSTMPSMCIGYESTIPPISLLAFYNGIANGGQMMRPRLVTKITRDNELVDSIKPKCIKKEMCSPLTLKRIKACLRYVVKKGTAQKYVYTKDYSSAGKTGTARIQEKGHTSEKLISFVGFFPIEKPKHTCMVTIRTPGNAGGGSGCGPVFKKIADYLMSMSKPTSFEEMTDSTHSIYPVVKNSNMLYTNKILEQLGYTIPEDWTVEKFKKHPYGKTEVVSNRAVNMPVEIGDSIMPDLIGMGARDAVFLLEKKKIKVNLVGVGKVISQSVAYGESLSTNKEVTLTLGLSQSELQTEGKDSLSTAAPVSTTSNETKTTTSNNTQTPPVTPAKSDSGNKQKPVATKPDNNATKPEDKKPQ